MRCSMATSPQSWHSPMAHERKENAPEQLLRGVSGVVAGAGSNLHLLPEQVKMVAGTGVDHDLRSTPVKMVAGGRNHLNLRSGGGRPLPVGAASNAGVATTEGCGFLSALFRAAA